MTNIGTLFYILWFLGTSLVPIHEIDEVKTPLSNESFAENNTLSQQDFDYSPDRLSNGPVRKIVIDAGHGGHDQGCAGVNSNEKTITLNIALALGAEIKRVFPEVEIIYTRRTDHFVALHERIGLANNEEADLFISIHANAFSDASVSGNEVYVMGLHTAEDNMLVAQRENAAILLENDFADNYDGFKPNSVEGQIILSMYQNNFLDKSIMLAKMITDQLALNTTIRNRGVRQAGFVIFRKASMPCVLIEAGFLSNAEDELILNSEKGQLQIASSIAKAIAGYKNDMDLEYYQMEAVRQKTEDVVKNLREQKIDQPLVYRVQIAAYVHENDIELPEQVAKMPIDLVYEGGMKKLLGGKFNSKEEAVAFRNEIRAYGFPEAFVVSYKGIERIDLNNQPVVKQRP
jgi:N-acetylmuramoyl-L-alanine amidase